MTVRDKSNWPLPADHCVENDIFEAELEKLDRETRLKQEQCTSIDRNHARTISFRKLMGRREKIRPPMSMRVYSTQLTRADIYELALMKPKTAAQIIPLHVPKYKRIEQGRVLIEKARTMIAEADGENALAEYIDMRIGRRTA